MRRFVDRTAQRFGKLLILESLRKDYGKRENVIFWRCQCDCGKVVELSSSVFSDGRQTSCGCHKSKVTTERSTKHGMSHTSTWDCYYNMISRCSHKNNKAYQNYGGRGITVCDRWKESFENFLQDMNEKPPYFQLDRIDNDGNYEPSNCKWVSRKENARNKRNSRFIIHNGERKTVAEWAELKGVKASKISSRLSYGWNVSDAIEQPHFCSSEVPVGLKRMKRNGKRIWV